MNQYLKHIASVLIAGVYLLFALGSGSGSSIEDLNARVWFDGTKFIITNNDSFDYSNVKLEVNGDYVLRVNRIEAGGTYTVDMMEFADSGGNRLDMMKKPQQFSIWCDTKDGNNGHYFGEL